jgi:hypothetical protein
MSRYATSDPNLISSTSDKREAPPLVAPPAAKKKRTTKKVLMEVIFPFLEHKPFFIPDKFSCAISDQDSATINNCRTCQCFIC